MLTLTQNKISQHLADTFNLPFKTAIFPDSLKIGKATQIQKRESKLVVSTYQPIPNLSNL